MDGSDRRDDEPNEEVVAETSTSKEGATTEPKEEEQQPDAKEEQRQAGESVDDVDATTAAASVSKASPSGAEADVVSTNTDENSSAVSAPSDDASVASQHTNTHARTPSKVEVIEAPRRNPQYEAPPPRVSESMSRTDSASSLSTPGSLRPDTAQHRPGDKPSSYQPSPPRSYMQLRAMALQLPNNMASTSSATHIEPPTIILEGRTNLSSARRSFYPKVSRTLPELHLWLLALTLSFPASIFSPFAYPSSGLVNSSTATDVAIRNYMVTITNQLGRILSKPYILSHPATVALVDCDFNYLPALPHIGPGSSVTARKKMEEGIKIARSGFDPLRGKRGKGGGTSSMTSSWDSEGVAAALGLPPSALPNYNETAAGSNIASASRNPLSIFSRANASPQRIQIAPPVALPPGEEDEDEEDLTLARNEITRLEMQFEKASQGAQMVVEKGAALNATLHQLNQALDHLNQLDAGRLIAKRYHEDEVVKIMTRGIEGWAAAENGVNATVLATIAPSMSYQSFNARMAIDALLRRAAAATHRHSALVVLVQKRREAERLKRARGEIRQDEVDWVLSELKEAQRTTNLLTHHLATFTATLKDELKNHSKSTHTDVQNALLNHARSSIRAHRFMLGSLTKARDELTARKEGKAVQSIGGETPLPVKAIVEEQVPVETPVKEVDYIAAGLKQEREGGQDVSLMNGQEEGAEQVEEGERESKRDQEMPEAAQGEIKTGALGQDKPLPPPNASEAAAVKRESVEERLAEHASLDDATPTLPSSAKLQESTVEAPPLATDGNGALNSNRGISQSGFLPPQSSHRSDWGSGPPLSPSATSTTTNLTQSAFLPARNMERYANPFARMDGSSLSSSSLLPGQGHNGFPSASSHHGAGPSPSTTGSPVKPSKPSNDVWANRNRLSASDAARSLAGRF